MQARDVMTTAVATVREETPIPAVARLMVECHSSGVPVVDAERIVGMVTEGDPLRRTELQTEKHRSHWLELLTTNVDLATEYVQAHGRTAGDVMSHDVINVAPDTLLSAIVDILERNRIKRVRVVDGGKLVGIVSRGNLVQALGSVSPDSRVGAVDDVRIRDQVLAEFRRLPGPHVGVECHRGGWHRPFMGTREDTRGASRSARSGRSDSWCSAG